MKRCPECRRDYYDDTLLYCLDDGNALLEGPASAMSRQGDHVKTGNHSDWVPGKGVGAAEGDSLSTLGNDPRLIDILQKTHLP